MSEEDEEKDIEKLKEFYKAEIERKDKVIEELKKENLALLQSALKQADKNEELVKAAERMQKLMEKK